MSLKYIIDEISSQIGLNSLELNPTQRTWLLRKINKAAEEVYESDDLPGCLREAYILVTPNSELALPEFIGRLRAVREANWKSPLSLIDLAPRYHAQAWKTEWNHFIYKGTSAVKFDIGNSAPPTITIPDIDSSLIVTIVGSTTKANRDSESVTMDDLSKTFTKSFLAYDSIEKNILGECNITVKDADGNELAIIYNDQLKSKYELYDVSAYPFGGDCTGNQRVMEILYKLPLKQLENDSDNFPLEGFDNVIVNKTLQIIAESEEGKEDRAVLMNQKASTLVQKKIQDKTGQIEKQLNYPRRKIFGMFHYSQWLE